MKKMAILNDTTMCLGCEECVAACKKTNATGIDKPWRWQRNIDDLSASRWTTIQKKPGNRYIRLQCRHCLDPACVSACLVGALTKTPEGAVVYDKSKCMGCRYCIMSCPYGIPRYSWASPVPYIQKCIMCYENINNGTLSEPACTAACPAKATVYGERDALISEAHHRIEKNPGRYVNRVFGEYEIGGTSVLYISDINLDFLGLKKDLGKKPLPETTWGALKIVPGLFSGVGIVMGGLWWIIERRMRLQNMNNANTDTAEPSEAVEKNNEEQ
jgi:formate dehydrogenase iron-sulfur subunit